MFKGLTGKQMCEYIVETFPELKMTPKQVWNISPTGELWPVFALYEAAKQNRVKMVLEGKV